VIGDEMPAVMQLLQGSLQAFEPGEPGPQSASRLLIDNLPPSLIFFPPGPSGSWRDGPREFLSARQSINQFVVWSVIQHHQLAHS
jgi:hypothetical protein